MARISFHLLILLFTLLAVIAQSKHSQPRIVGGTRATEKVRRHLVNLALYGEGEDSQVCSGTILDRTHILTAAHCLYEDGSTFSYEYSYAYIGQKSFNPSNAEEFYFSRAWIPKRYYRREDSGFDIAVIELDTEIPDNLYYPVTMGDEPKPGRKAIVAGYGLTSTDGDFPNFAMQTRVIARSFDDCENEDELAEEGVLKEKYLVCAVSVGYPNKGKTDSCQGDSGGPLFFKQKGKLIQYGITAFSYYDCAAKGGIPWYVRMSAFKTQVERILDNGRHNRWRKL
ncbi:unnamed protein product [Agarophyton chilense]